MRTILRAALVALLLSPLAHAATVASVFDGRVPCVPAGLGQLCSSAGIVNRVETWDGVPLDVTLLLPPAEQDGPFPLIIDLHGFGAGKTPNPEIDALAQQGYATLRVIANGTTSSDETFVLPKEGWKAAGSAGFRYAHRVPGGAVKRASIRRTPRGTLQIRVMLQGRDAPLDVVPPNQGSDGGFILALGGGDSYCVAFGGVAGGLESKDDARQWAVRNPAAVACLAPAP